jgi:hypothetical protein
VKVSSELPPRGHPCLFPLEVREELHASSLVANFGPQGEQAFYAVWGTSKSGEPRFALAFDHPIQVAPPRDKLTKEMDDVRTFLTQNHREDDFNLSPGPHPNQPPDVFADRGGQRIGIEATQLLMPSDEGRGNLTSISRAKVFDQLRDDLLSRSARLKGGLRQHRGHILYIWFAGQDSVARGMPCRKTSVDDLEALLKTSHPPQAIGPGPLPPQAPPDSVRWSKDRQIGVSWGDLPRGYISTTTRMLGFELGLAYNAEVSQSDVRTELRRLLEQHDHPAAQLVLVTVNASLASGTYFPSSHLLSRMVFEDPDPLQGWTPQNAEGVVVHDPADSGKHRWLHGSPSWWLSAASDRLPEA